MPRVLRAVVLPLAITASVLALAVACNDDKGAPCKVDTDCPTGNICREEICGSPNPDGGGAIDASTGTDASTSCSSDGILCTLSSECCSGICAETHCAQSAPSTPACKNVYEICQNDCCSGLSCINGACR